MCQIQTLKPAAHEDGKVVGLTHRPPLPLQEIFLVLISSRRWVDPRVIVWPEGVYQEKFQRHYRESNPRPSALPQPNAPPRKPVRPQSVGGNALTAAFMILFFIIFHALTRPDLGGAVSLACSISYTVIIHVALVVKACESNENWLRGNKIRAEKSWAR